MNTPGENREELQESPPQIQRAQAVLAFLGEKADKAVLFIPEREADPIVNLQLGARRLEFNRDTIKYTGDERTASHIFLGPYGAFKPEEMQVVADFLLNPESVPPSIMSSVKEIKSGLIAGGISEDRIRVEWPDPARTDKPIMKQSGQPNRELKFGLYSPGTINAYEDGNDQGLTYGNGAIRFLQGLWYNEGEWDNKYKKMPDGNYRIKES